jgi:hypothetical protein
MAARKRALSVRQVESWRTGIQVGMIRHRLHQCVRGEIEMTYVQLGAAKILLDKAIPNLTSVEHTGKVEHTHVREYTDAELIAIIERERLGRIDDEAPGTDLVTSVHGIHDPELEGGEDPSMH